MHDKSQARAEPTTPTRLLKVTVKDINADERGDSVGTVGQDRHSEQSLRQVYLFQCCGSTRELRPAHEHWPAIRCLFVVANVLVFGFAFANFGMGLWFRIDPKVYEIHKYIETQNFTIAGWLQLFAGFSGCLISLVGFVCALGHNVSLLLFYLCTLTTLMLALACTVILLTVFGLGSVLEKLLVKELYEQLRRKTMNPEVEVYGHTDAAQFIDFVQVKMRCCGAFDFRDYQRLGMVVPTSCYTISGNYLNAPGCGKAIRRLMDIRAGLAVGFCTGSVVAQLFAILLAAMMICSIYSWRTRSTPIAVERTGARSDSPQSSLAGSRD